jgi:hypothetical protein
MQPHARAAVHAAIYIASAKRGAPSNSLIEPNVISFCWLHVHTHLCQTRCLYISTARIDLAELLRTASQHFSL